MLKILGEYARINLPFPSKLIGAPTASELQSAYAIIPHGIECPVFQGPNPANQLMSERITLT